MWRVPSEKTSCAVGTPVAQSGNRCHPAWLAHFHHHSFAWLQRWSASGKRELERLASDFHSVLASEPTVRDIAWYHESDMRRADAPSSTTPNAA